MKSAQPYFPPFEAAVDLFQRTAGLSAKVTAIRSPRKWFDEFRAAFPEETARDVRYHGAAVQLVETQDFVSVRGTTIEGHEFEWPEPS